MRIAKRTLLYEGRNIGEVGGSFSDLSLFVFWDEDGITFARCLFRSETVDHVTGIYRGSISSGRWSGVTRFLVDGENPAVLMNGNRPELVLWERDGTIVAAPSRLSSEIITAQTTLKAALEADLAVELANDGRFTVEGAPYQEYFSSEKSVGLELGYGDELHRIATCQIESVNASRGIEGGTIVVKAKNKYIDLLALPMSKTYGPKYPARNKEVVISGFTVDEPIPPGQVVEIRIEAPAPVRWIPGSMELANIVAAGEEPGQVTISRIYGQTEIMGFVLISNLTESEVSVRFDVLAAPITSSAFLVMHSVQVREEEVTLTGTDPVRLENKSIDGEKNRRIIITNQDETMTYVAYNEEDPEAWWDYAVGLDADGYTTITRNAEGNIADGQTVKVTYEFAVGITGAIKIKKGTNSADAVLLFADEWEPQSLQIRITGVTGGGTGDSLETYKEKYAPYHVLFSPSVNGTGLQVALTKTNATGDLTVYYELWARPYKSKIGEYWSAADVLRDIVRLATYKDLKIGEYDGTLEAGQFSDSIFITMEESIDPDTIRVENSGSDDVQVSLIAAGYIPNDDGGESWGVRVAVTRAMPTGLQQKYSFQIWGQFTARADFFYPLDLVIPELPDTVFDRPLHIVDQTIEDSINKVLQTCFAEDRAAFKMVLGPLGELVVKPYRLDSPAVSFKARNMASIAKATDTPQVYDRVQIKGAVTPSYLVTTKRVLLHDQSETALTGPKLVNNFYIDIQFDREIRPETLELEVLWTKKARIWIHKRSTKSCTLCLHNTSNGNYRTPKAKFRLYGVPLESVHYQEDYIYKTGPGLGGKYRNPTAVVENEMIMSGELADLIGSNIVLESANGAIVWMPEEMPFDPTVEPMDTVLGEFEELDINARGIVEEVDISFDASGIGPELYMNLTVKPFDRYAAGFGYASLWFNAADGLPENYEFNANESIKRFLNLLLG